ncbi:hypothetical protein Scep_030283 [Stephania cephalantha]|uniref:Uncharacterized protein n=1 Tax=Stephania cephalantha TaxID=152367 RepID=A0AAP0E2V9_9MAGN
MLPQSRSPSLNVATIGRSPATGGSSSLVNRLHWMWKTRTSIISLFSSSRSSHRQKRRGSPALFANPLRDAVATDSTVGKK